MAAIDLVILIVLFTWQFTWNVTTRLVVHVLIKRRKSNSHRHYSQADLTKLQLRTSQRKDFTSVTLRQSLSHKQWHIHTPTTPYSQKNLTVKLFTESGSGTTTCTCSLNSFVCGRWIFPPYTKSILTCSEAQNLTKCTGMLINI